MKRKFILLPITLTALAPAIALVGCDNNSKYKKVELNWDEGFEEFKSEYLTFEKNKGYNLVIKHCPPIVVKDEICLYFSLYEQRYVYFVPDVTIDKVLANGKPVHFELGPGSSATKYVIQIFLWESSDVDIYITFNEGYVNGCFELC